MPKAKAIAAALVGASILTIAGAPSLLARETARRPAASDARARAQAIVARMTFDEKIALLHGLFPPRAAGKTWSAANAASRRRRLIISARSASE